MGSYIPSMNAVDGCYKTWKYTAVHLVDLHNGFGNVASGLRSCLRLPKKLSATSLSKQSPTRLMLGRVNTILLELVDENIRIAIQAH